MQSGFPEGIPSRSNEGTSSTELLGRWLKAQTGPKALEYVLSSIQDYRQQYRQGRADPGCGYQGATLGVYEAIDQLHEQSTNEVKKDITCRRGCAFCCHILVDISLDEAKTILDYCQENQIPLDLNYLRCQASIPDPLKQARSAYPACVFLKNNECSIYSMRPVACRKYFVVSDPLLCDSSKNIEKIKIFFDLQSEVLVSATLNESISGPMAKMLLQAIQEKQSPS